MATLSSLNWDSDFFNKKIGKITCDRFDSVSEVNKLFRLAKNEQYSLIYLFSETKIDETLLSSFNGELVDTKVVFQKSVLQIDHPLNLNITSHKNKELNSELIDLAHLSGEHSRFKNDKNFSNEDFTNLYNEWLKKSVSGEIADEVFVYSELNKIIGFITVTIKDTIGSVGLIAVNQKCQGKKIGTKLLSQVEFFLYTNNIMKLQVPTQRMNKLACDFYLKNNFELISSQPIYHFNIF